ncbi:hypothetical protein, partial [Salmonella enterica]|uniref:hypothetical protein n=1 Tax=Salmonella enterica TaxID=28901 RepID=UPI003296D143
WKNQLKDPEQQTINNKIIITMHEAHHDVIYHHELNHLFTQTSPNNKTEQKQIKDTLKMMNNKENSTIYTS